MLLKNPTSNELSIKFEGTAYTLPANGEISVPANVASYWQEHIHSFLTVSPDKAKTEKVVEEKVEAPVEAPKKPKAK